MGILGKIFKGIVKQESEDLVYVGNLAFPGVDTTTAIEVDKHYVELRVETLRIEKARSWATRFNGVVYSFVTLARQADTDAVIPAISKPQKLAELDPDSLGNVITVSKQMMGAVPWRGDPFGLELGLFSIKAGNVLTPFVNFVTKVSETAGISFVGAVKPFVPLITEGLELLSGQKDDVQLEVGIDTSISLTHPMVCAIIAAKRGSLDTSKLTVDPDGTLKHAGQAVKAGYCIFSIRSSTQKADYGEIPELKQKFAELRAAAIKDDRKAAADALAAFRRAALFSPDLITSDAKRLVAMAQEMFDDAFAVEPAFGAAPHVVERGGAIGGGRGKELPKDLAALPLYAGD